MYTYFMVIGYSVHQESMARDDQENFKFSKKVVKFDNLNKRNKSEFESSLSVKYFSRCGLSKVWNATKYYVDNLWLRTLVEKELPNAYMKPVLMRNWFLEGKFIPAYFLQNIFRYKDVNFCVLNFLSGCIKTLNVKTQKSFR